MIRIIDYSQEEDKNILTRDTKREPGIEASVLNISKRSGKRVMKP